MLFFSCEFWGRISQRGSVLVISYQGGMSLAMLPGPHRQGSVDQISPKYPFPSERLPRRGGGGAGLGKLHLLEGRVATPVVYCGRFVSFSSCIYLCKLFVYISMEACVFILCLGLHSSRTLFILLLKWFHLWPPGAPSIGSRVPRHARSFSGPFLAFQHRTRLQAHLVFSPPLP